MSNRLLTKTVDVEAGTVTLTVRGQEPIRVALGELSPEMRDRAALHGLAQKLGDAIAGARGRGWTAAECADTIRALADRIRDGAWNDRGATGSGLVAEAIARLTGRDLADVRARLADMGEEERRRIAKRADVAAEVARIRAERLAERAQEEGSDLDDLI